VFGPNSTGRRRDQSSFFLSIFRNVLLATPLHDSLHYCPQQHCMPLTTMNMPSQRVGFIVLWEFIFQDSIPATLITPVATNTTNTPNLAASGPGIAHFVVLLIR
jgi:hypothetical protein